MNVSQTDVGHRSEFLSLRRNAKDADKHVGQRIRERRIRMGQTLQQMADMIGVTYQQAHKYERAINRISAGRLFAIAEVLGVDIGYFYEGFSTFDRPGLSDQQRQCLELSRNFMAIADSHQREAVNNLARILAAGEPVKHRPPGSDTL